MTTIEERAWGYFNLMYISIAVPDLLERLKKVTSDFSRVADEWKACIQYNCNKG